MSSYGVFLKKREGKHFAFPAGKLQEWSEDDTVSLVSGRINLSTAPRHYRDQRNRSQEFVHITEKTDFRCRISSSLFKNMLMGTGFIQSTGGRF